MYKNIVTFERGTGNGGGDPDVLDPEETSKEGDNIEDQEMEEDEANDPDLDFEMDIVGGEIGRAHV